MIGRGWRRHRALCDVCEGSSQYACTWPAQGARVDMNRRPDGSEPHHGCSHSRARGNPNWMPAPVSTGTSFRRHDDLSMAGIAHSHGTGFVPWAFQCHNVTNPRHEKHAVATGSKDGGHRPPLQKGQFVNRPYVALPQSKIQNRESKMARIFAGCKPGEMIKILRCA